MADGGNAIKLKLRSKDGATLEVDKAVAVQMNFVRGMLEGEPLCFLGLAGLFLLCNSLTC